MSEYMKILKDLKINPKTWLVTGAAGFIGSNLVERLLHNGQRVIGIDNFSNGYQENIDSIKANLNAIQQERFQFIEGDIRDLDTCKYVCRNVDIILNEAALGSVPRSVANPIATNENNVSGTLNMLVAAKECNVKRFVTASSSSVYGDNPDLPKKEERVGQPLSPYAVSKATCEAYAQVFSKVYGMENIILRYFNVFGPRQNPDNPYAAVIPKWFAGLIRGDEICIFGDGETSRDFCFLENVIQANILAGCTSNEKAFGQVFNIAYCQTITLNELYKCIKELVGERYPEVMGREPEYRDFRAGDIRHSLADINKAKEIIGYQPTHSVFDGLKVTAEWYMNKMN